MCLRFSLVFESEVAEVCSAQTRLNVLNQRLAFAKGRVETVQGTTVAELHVYCASLLFMWPHLIYLCCCCFSGLFLRKVALHKVQQASKQSQQDVDRWKCNIITHQCLFTWTNFFRVIKKPKIVLFKMTDDDDCYCYYYNVVTVLGIVIIMTMMMMN